MRYQSPGVLLFTLEQHGPAARGRTQQNPGVPSEQRPGPEVMPEPAFLAFGGEDLDS